MMESDGYRFLLEVGRMDARDFRSEISTIWLTHTVFPLVHEQERHRIPKISLFVASVCFTAALVRFHQFGLPTYY